MSDDREYEAITYEVPAEGVVRIMLDRPEVANAQDKQMLYELNAGFDRAVADDDIKVIIRGVQVQSPRTRSGGNRNLREQKRTTDRHFEIFMIFRSRFYSYFFVMAIVVFPDFQRILALLWWGGLNMSARLLEHILLLLMHPLLNGR